MSGEGRGGLMASGERPVTDPAAVEDALARLLASKAFVRSKNLRRFLEFTVSHTLAGDEAIKESTIAVEAYGRPTSYDPRHDPIVRTDALRLRKKLRAYYEDEGSEDPVRIHYPKGSYVPLFAPARELTPTDEGEREEATPPRPASRWLPLAAIVAVGGAVGLATWLPRNASNPLPPRVAVLRFDDFSQGGDQAALALATTEALIAMLSRQQGLEVVSRGAAMRVEEASRSVQDVGSRLKADYLVEGSVQRVGESCRITAQLVRVEDDANIWAEQYSFDWPRVLEVQEDIARDVAAEIGARVARVGPRKASPQATKSPGAYEALSRARYAMSRFSLTDSPEYLEQADREIARGLELDPDYTDALAEAAYFKLQRIYPPRAGAEPVVAETREFLARALRIDPEHVRSLYLMGQVEAMLGNRREALTLTFRAVELDPGDPDVHVALAILYAKLGFNEAAAEEAKHATELNTEWLLPYRLRVHLLARMGRIEEAREALTELEALTGQVPTAARFVATVELHASDLEAAMTTLDRSIARYQGHLQTTPQEVLRGLVAALQGDVAEGQRVLDKYRGTHPFWDDLANLALVLGETEAALSQIENAPMASNYRWLATNPYAKPYLRQPAFVTLLDRLYADWQSSLEFAGGRLPASPPSLPSPQDLLESL